MNKMRFCYFFTIHNPSHLNDFAVALKRTNEKKVAWPVNTGFYIILCFHPWKLEQKLIIFNIIQLCLIRKHHMYTITINENVVFASG